MTKRARLVWRQRILLGLVAAVSTILIAWIAPWNQPANQATEQPVTDSVQAQDKERRVKDDTSSSKGEPAELLAQKNEAFGKMVVQLEQEVKLTFSIPEQFQGKTIKEAKLNSNEKVIALTFDDGPWAKWTEKVLDILKKNDVKATFFMVGEVLEEYPQIAKQVVADGHAIGNHTWTHPYHQFDEAGASREIDRTAELIYKTTGVKTSLFRPPGGYLTNGLAAYAQKQKYVVAMWSSDSIDYRRPSPDRLAHNVLKNAKPGGIVLMHDGGGDRSNTVQALPQIISELKKQGYKFVTLPELLEMQDKEKASTTAAIGN